MKEEIISLLKENKDNFISGEKISEKFGITRAAIWKYMKAIKNEGYKIESVSRKGYKLISSPDLLTFQEINPY
ncbi:biotin operon repressor, partial [Clostridium haemolyticum]